MSRWEAPAQIATSSYLPGQYNGQKQAFFEDFRLGSRQPVFAQIQSGVDQQLHSSRISATNEAGNHHYIASPPEDVRSRGNSNDSGKSYHGSVYNHHRMSGSSFAPSTSGTNSDVASFDDFSARTPAAFNPDYALYSNSNRLLPASQLPTNASPMRIANNVCELARTRSMPSRPYPPSSQRHSPTTLRSMPEVQIPYAATPMAFGPTAALGNQYAFNPLEYQSYQLAQPSSTTAAFPHNGHVLSSNAAADGNRTQLPQPAPIPSNVFTLEGNDQHVNRSTSKASTSQPPDFFGTINVDKIDEAPPPDPTCPADIDATPIHQEGRYPADLYTPRYVRGAGERREGYCFICQRWLVLKNSAYWYDKLFTHGISEPGRFFAEPLQLRRAEKSALEWEAFCGECREWIAINSKKKGTSWFRHAHQVSGDGWIE